MIEIFIKQMIKVFISHVINLTLRFVRLDWDGGAAMVNDNFIWISYNAFTFKILRHEIGHNMKHDHHSRNNYLYRTTRPDLVTDNVYKSDGLDMVSGGLNLH